MISIKNIIVLSIFLLKKVLTDNKFIFHPVYENGSPGTYIRPAISENGYLFIMTGEDVPNDTIRNRYIVKFNINSGAFVEQISYKSNYGFWRGQFVFAGENSEYLIVTSFAGEDIKGHSLEFFNIKNSKSKQIEYEVYGYRRVLKKVGSYYYYIFLDPEKKTNMIINKMELNYNSGDDFPSYKIIQSTNRVKAVPFEAMISCDFTKDSKNILCAYFSEKHNVTISVFNSNLNLILTKELEYFPIRYELLDTFIQLIYFKDNSKFVLMNSETNYTIRFRYFNFVNNNLQNQLNSIINKDYLDIEETHFYLHDGDSDIIVADFDRIIKLYTHVWSNLVIITIIQFYENDSYFTIKIYYMYNNNGFKYFCQGRLAMFRNSFLVCASAAKNELHRGGYFFINFPNSTDITLSSNIIKLQNLISIENNLFSLNRKFKVLNIPKDFIFINTFNSLEIKNDDILDINNELKLKQYRIKEGVFILKYEAIAVGDDSGYRIMKIYPENIIGIKTPEIYIEGRQGSININFQDCLDGYYKLDYDLHLCTNVKPKGYYLDKINNIYKACTAPCSECSGPKINNTFMNCLECKNNYYLTEDTKSCYENIIDNYYLDNNILRRCHSNCKKCISKEINSTFMNCLECKNNYYLTEDTKSCYSNVIDNYYLDNNILRRCHSNCKKCNYKAINSTFMNCLECKNNYYLTEDTKSCYSNVIDNYYLNNNILRRCHSYCKKCNSKAINSTFMNCLECNNNYYLTEDTKSCYSNIIDNYYLDNNILRKCHSNCKKCISKAKNNTFMNCFECKINFYMTEDTYSCYSSVSVIDNYYLDKNMLRRCHPKCKRCSSVEIDDNFMNCLECNNKFYLTEDTHSCYSNVIDNYYLDINILRSCFPNCKKCTSKAINSTFMNCLECKNKFYMTEDTNSCYETEIDNYYLDINTLRRCHPNCKKCTSKEINETYMNCLECKDGFYLTEDTNSCYDRVIENYYLDNNFLRRCHPRCKWCTTGSNNNEQMNCNECLNDEKHEYIYQNDTTNCILDSEFIRQQKVFFSILQNYNFYIFMSIFVVSLIVSFIIFYLCIFKNEEVYGYKKVDNNSNKKISVELNSINNNE